MKKKSFFLNSTIQISIEPLWNFLEKISETLLVQIERLKCLKLEEFFLSCPTLLKDLKSS